MSKNSRLRTVECLKEYLLKYSPQVFKREDKKDDRVMNEVPTFKNKRK